ncbi:phenylalanine--tRNA ligase subunit beta [Alloscardovia macacae]|uniref:Phenylalanine--tRNA ligase beta subunit n=1 Tax=Alloscardovia macacae TaxID=1160091 RepID=A0A1Y2T1T1_9BIFI|nr:phenylalanine--tRNA ligase subunit beta [Alloscardovia macacae]OTA26178.1 phenylalanine--tRNA ligase subunit beta [Alloscardovia macacae]OTA29971.1 phenylalanine--tRNA ligase subunit beta [Alloscardovia macacae]
MPLLDMNWLRDHVAVPDSETYHQLATDLVKVGLEEEEIHTSQVTGPIVVGYVKELVPEPQKNGKVINWCQVDVGEHNVLDEDGHKVPRGIVCGAPNIKAGEKVVVTLPGAVLPGDFKIEPRKTYGHISNGMCASERELGLGSDHNGIILFSQYGLTQEQYDALEPGQDAMEILGLHEPTLEINITPDRGYAFSYRGVAREFHHSTGAPFTDKALEYAARAEELSASDGSEGSEVQVIIEDTNPIHGVPGCDRYYARTVRGINASAQSSSLVRQRLLRSGMRPLSAAVDVTNYVMLDVGQPLHAYDLDKIEQPIVVRRAVDGEKLTTLDGKEHELVSEDLLITDSPNGEKGSRILGIAGVMGGLYGEVTAETTNVLLEGAHFDPISIARSARRHKIPSEASRRFERGVDTKLQAAAVYEAAEMLTSVCGGLASSYPTDIDATSAPEAITFRTSEVARLTGLDTSAEEIQRILEDVGCTVEAGEVAGDGEVDTFRVTPPTWRPDITEPCDLVEEVARLVGYDQIAVTVPAVPASAAGHSGLTDSQLRRRQVADTLAEYGLTETISYPFVGEEDFKDFALNAEEIIPVSVELENPLAGDRPYLRRDVLLTLMRTVQRNFRRGNLQASSYELGHVFEWDPQAPAIPALPGGVRPSDEELAALDAGLPKQPLHVAAVFTGTVQETGWMGEKRTADWTDAVEAVTRISERLAAHLSLTQVFGEDVPATWHPGRFAYVKVAEGAGDVTVGRVGELHPHVIESLGLPAHTAAFELDLDALFAAVKYQPLQAKPVSTYPPVHQDFAFIVPVEMTSDEMSAVVREAAGDLLESIDLFDVFVGPGVGLGKKSLAYAVTFRAQDRTLDASDTEAVRAQIIAAAEAVGAVLRA